MEVLSGAQIIVRLLERQGIEDIAGYPGGAVLPIYDALSQSSKINHILVRHEQACGFIAQGMARTSGKTAACLATSGPGATNLITAIADATMDSVPIVAITGQVASPAIGSDAFQEVDTYGLTIPITKHSYLVQSAKDLLTIIPRAFTIAASGRPGTVWIDIPKDVQQEMIEVEQWPEPGIAEPPALANLASLQEAAAMINQSKRPVLYVGGGIVQSDAGNLVETLATKANIPVAATLMALGALPDNPDLRLGMLGQHGAAYVHHVLDDCDLLIAIGCRFDDRVTGHLAGFCPQAEVIHIDIDASELGKIMTTSLEIRADAHQALEVLVDEVEFNLRDSWIAQIQCWRQEIPSDFSTGEPRELIRQVAEAAGTNAVIVTDVGQHQMWVAQSYPKLYPRKWLTSGGFGTMGFGLPAAIGAAVADPDCNIICFTGDGSILMNIQELATLAQLRTNVKVIVLDNSALGLVRQQQALFYGERYFASQLPDGPDFVELAKAFGIAALKLNANTDLQSALSEALATPGPYLISAPINEAEMVFPMVPPGAANLASIGA